jgi:hypothetical protein
MSIHPEGKACSDLGRVLVLNDLPVRGASSRRCRVRVPSWSRAMPVSTSVGRCRLKPAQPILKAPACAALQTNI